jgi:hypothetical protein
MIYMINALTCEMKLRMVEVKSGSTPLAGSLPAPCNNVLHTMINRLTLKINGFSSKYTVQ